MLPARDCFALDASPPLSSPACLGGILVDIGWVLRARGAERVRFVKRPADALELVPRLRRVDPGTGTEAFRHLPHCASKRPPVSG